MLRQKSPFIPESASTPVRYQDLTINIASLCEPFDAVELLYGRCQAEQTTELLHYLIAQEPDAKTPQIISPEDIIPRSLAQESQLYYPLPQHSFAEFDAGQTSEAELPPSYTSDAKHGIKYLDAHLTSLDNRLPYPPIIYPHHSMSSSTETASVNSAANTGTYTCTYQWCPYRFETIALLQQHKRQEHRQTLGITRPRDTGRNSTTDLSRSQAGPHHCGGINPSTGRVCNEAFSRPYDLTRHQDTIHNAHKQKIGCNLCVEQRTFSGADALTRHYRVCHPDAPKHT